MILYSLYGMISKHRNLIYFQLNEKVNHDSISVVIDPDYWVLKKCNFIPLLPVHVIDNISENNSVTISPNPSFDVLSVQYSSQYDHKNFIIFDMYGKIVRSGFLDKGATLLSIQDLPSGIYLFRISNGNNEINKKFVRQ